MLYCSFGISARYCATSAPLASRSSAPTTAQSECRLPEEKYHLPETTRPPSTRRVLGEALNTPATRASGLAPNTSCCARSQNRLVNQAQTLVSATTQAVPPQASASAAETFRWERSVPSWPPKRLGTIRRNNPASRIASMLSSAARRLRSASTACWRSSGCSASARLTSSSRLGPCTSILATVASFMALYLCVTMTFLSVILSGRANPAGMTAATGRARFRSLWTDYRDGAASRRLHAGVREE
ncbi:hypothetical protein D3C76_794950 [compost metagenome]